MPNKRADNMRAFSITANVQHIAAIDEYCKAHGITRSEFYRLASVTLLDALKGKTETTTDNAPAADKEA